MKRRKHSGRPAPPSGRSGGAANTLARAIQLHQAGRLREADALYRQVLSAEPEHPDALHFYGILAHQTGNHEAAAGLIGKAVQIHPHHPQAHNNLGNVLLALGRTEEAAEAFRTAQGLAPDMVEAPYNLGNALYELKRFPEAEQAYRRAIELAPDHAGAYNNLGNVLREAGRLTDAVAAYQRAAELSPDQAEVHNNLGIAFKAMGRLKKAVAAYEQAIARAPRDGEARHNLGNALRDLKRLDDAISAYRKAVDLRPDLSEAWNQLLYLNRQVCDWEELERLEDTVMERARTPDGSMTPFPLIVTPLSAREQAEAARAYAGRQFDALVRQGPVYTGTRPASDRITVGYLSADLHEHATAFLTAGLFECHDRDRFRVLAYSLGPDDGSAMRQRLIRAFDHFVDLRTASHREAAERICADGVDILVDLKGYTNEGRPEILALRPAPIQVSYLGYPGTMGADFIDYLVGDAFLIPEGAESGYTEQIVRLPDSYQVNDRQRPISQNAPTREACGLPAAGFVFCSLNNSYKITPRMFDIWMGLLRDVPGSVLWLLESNPHVPGNLRREAHARGIDGARLMLAPKRPNPDYLAQYRHADLFLDTHPCGAHTTASDALWGGCPVLTCAGQHLAARVAGSLLHAVGLAELVTESLDEYAARARHLAHHPGELGELRARLAEQRLSAPLFDCERFTRHLEAAYRAMWDRHRAGAPPAPIRIEPDER